MNEPCRANLGFLIYILDIVMDMVIAGLLYMCHKYLFFGLCLGSIFISCIISNAFAQRILWDDDEGYEFLQCRKKGILCMSLTLVLPMYSHLRNLYLIWKGHEVEVVWVNKNLKLLHGILHTYPQLCLQSIVMALDMTKGILPYTIQWISLCLSVWVFAHGFITYAFNSLGNLDKFVLFSGCWIAAVSRITISGILCSYFWALWFLPSGISLIIVIIIYQVCRYFKTAALTQHFFPSIAEQDINPIGCIPWIICGVFDTFSWLGLCVSGVYLLTSGVSMYMDDNRSTVAFYLACFITVLNAASVSTRKYRIIWASNTDLY